MITQTRSWYDRMGAYAYSPHANSVLGVLFFIEAIFFIPTDPILILYCLQRQQKAFLFAAVATVCSVLGGLTSYMIGYYLWEYAGEDILSNSWVRCILSRETFEIAALRYQENEWLAIFIGGFTPVPYKAATLTAGFCKLSLIPFITASLVSRGARFFAYAILINLFGVEIKETIGRYFGYLMVGSLVIIVATIYLLK